MSEHVERAEAHLMTIEGDVLSRLDAFVQEAFARSAVAEASGENDAALLWADAAEGVLPLLDYLAARATGRAGKATSA